MNYGLLDPRFKYVPAAKTNVAKTFARIRREMAEKAQADADAMKNVKPIRKEKKA